MNVHPILASMVLPALISLVDTDVSVFQDIRVSTANMKSMSVRISHAGMEAPVLTS